MFVELISEFATICPKLPVLDPAVPDTLKDAPLALAKEIEPSPAEIVAPSKSIVLPAINNFLQRLVGLPKSYETFAAGNI